MPWKLILFILSVVLVTIFIGFNLENACDVSFGAYVFKDVPVFMSILLAFALGVLIMLPFTFGHGKKIKQIPKKQVVAQKPPVYSGNKTSSEVSSSSSKVNSSESSVQNSSSTTEVK